ncbi:formyltransferase family protein, partial [Chromatium okenii]|uniref:formyltransferase family protein n=1 Tax=Chromatium okenii TaxID=61644 RepID=UPI0026EB2E20
MKLLLLTGGCCPEWHIDYREQLLLHLLDSPHQLVTLIAAVGDPLAAVAEQQQIPVQLLLPELNQSRQKIQAALNDSAFQKQFSAWLKLLRQPEPDLGICFYGNWLPPVLFELPTRGFLNFHPGPLPELQGMEPDTFAILEGRASTHGTVHVVTENFDEGAIVAITPELPLINCMTPPQVFRALTQLGITTLIDTITAIETGSAIYQPQDLTQATDATRQRARLEAYLDFQHDDAAIIDRRRRAFLSQDIGIRLKAKIKQQV